MRIIKLFQWKLPVSLAGFLFLAVIVVTAAQQSKPEKINRLVTPQLTVTFDNRYGLPVRYDLPELNEQFIGKEEGQSIKIVVKKASGKSEFKLNPDVIKTGNGEIFMPGRTDTIINPVLKKINISVNQADVCYDGYLGNLKIVTFNLRYLVKGQSVFLTMEEVVEGKGYELVEIQTKSLASINQKEKAAWLAHGDGGGYYTDLAGAKPSALKDGWSKDFPYFPNFSYLPLVMMGNGKVNCSMEVQGYLCNTQLEVSGNDGQKSATMGVKSYYRVKGESIISLPVEQKEICRIDFTGDYDQNKKSDWLDAAKAVRDRMPEIPTHYYDDRMVWIISGQPGRAEKATITFPEIEKVIRKIHLLTDGVPQAVYISGWTEGGHDTGYPNVTELNKKMGGLSGFMQLKEKALPYDANISFDDNYDDQFNNEYTKGHFDEQYIARNVD